MRFDGDVDHEEPIICKEFIQRSGGKAAKIVILPQASGLAITGQEYGKNAITILDGKEMVARNVAEATASRPIAVSGLRIHVLTGGCPFDMNTRKAYVPGIRLRREKAA